MANERTTIGNQEEAATSLPQIELPLSISVKQLADVLEVEPAKVIKQLMRRGIMANINQTIDFDAASKVVAGFGYNAQQKVDRKGLGTALGFPGGCRPMPFTQTSPTSRG